MLDLLPPPLIRSSVITVPWLQQHLNHLQVLSRRFPCMVDKLISDDLLQTLIVFHWMYPPGGFTNFLQSDHFVGTTTRKTTISPIASSSERTPIGGSNAREKETIDVDDNANGSPLDHRTEKRLNWTKDEDIRLATAWFRNSKDPADENDRKANQFWLDVTKEYNDTTESCRKRNRNQLKIRWDRVKKLVSGFHGCWIKTNRVYRSGFSDDQLMDLADKMFASTHNDKDFMLKHI